MKLQDYLEKYGNVSVDEKELNDVLGVKPKEWEPEDGEFYWCVDSSGEVKNHCWSGDKIDIGILKYLGVYKTREEAKLERDKQKFLRKMKRDFEDNSDVIDWGNKNQPKYYLIYDKDKVMFTPSVKGLGQGSFYTSNFDWLSNYIKENREDIEKYVFDL